MNIVVLGGGDSTEREVSLRSAAAVRGALEQAGYETTLLDPQNGFEVLDNLPPRSLVFPILHGQNGEDGVIQRELEKRNLPFLGCDSRVSAICFDKWETRLALERAGLPVADGAKVDKETYAGHELAAQPHVLKVTEGGSSIGTLIVRDPKLLAQSQIDEVFALGAAAVVEQLIEGVEVTVPVLDGTALPVIEIEPPADKEFDYENKYNGATKELCPPVSINADMQLKAQKLAEQAHLALGCRHLSRTDMIVQPTGKFVILETNTMPGMTEQSLFPLSAKASGLPMPELMKKFVAMVKRDYGMET